MSFFGLSSKTDRFGVIIDIGSGSVAFAIVHSDQTLKHPTIIWSHRENAPLKNIDSIEDSLKSIVTAMLSAAMRFDSEGRKVLDAYRSGAKITDVQFGVSAPWSYSVTKTVTYEQEEPFEITTSLIEDLIQAAQDKINHELDEGAKLNHMGLDVVLQSTMSVLSNGYQVHNPQGEQGQQINISHASVVVSKKLIKAMETISDKVLMNIDTKKLSFIIMLFSVTKDLLPNTHDSCLVDITYEATEIGIVRNGVLTYCTHIPFGSFSLAREISAITKVPLHEAFGYLHTEKPYEFMTTVSEQAKQELERVFDAYVTKVTALFAETGDNLSIPKHIALHTELASENLYMDLIEKAAKRSLKTQPIITKVSKEIITQTYEPSTESAADTIPPDTALLASAQFFHKQPTFKDYQYL